MNINRSAAVAADGAAPNVAQTTVTNGGGMGCDINADLFKTGCHR